MVGCFWHAGRCLETPDLGHQKLPALIGEAQTLTKFELRLLYVKYLIKYQYLHIYG